MPRKTGTTSIGKAPVSDEVKLLELIFDQDVVSDESAGDGFDDD